MSLIDTIIRSSYNKTPFLRFVYIININSKLQLPPPIYFNYANKSLCKLYSNCSDKKFTDTNKFKAFKEKQAKMQCDDGYPVHLKGGILDKILYHITVVGCIIGIVQCIRFIHSTA